MIRPSGSRLAWMVRSLRLPGPPRGTRLHAEIDRVTLRLTLRRRNDGSMQPGVRAEAVELDELLVTVVVDNATDTLSSIPAGVPQRSELAGLLDGPFIGTHEGHE